METEWETIEMLCSMAMTRGEGGDLFKSSKCSLDPKQEPVSITGVSYTSTEGAPG